MSLVGREEDLRLYQERLDHAKTVSKRNFLRQRMNDIYAEDHDAVIAKLRHELIAAHRRSDHEAISRIEKQIDGHKRP